MQISLNFETSCCNLKIGGLGANCVWLFYYFNFENNNDVFKWKSPCILLNKNVNFNKTKRNQKCKILHTVLERPTLCSYKNRKLNVKLWWVGAYERKKRAFLNICVLSQCIVYRIYFQNIHSFTYQKTLLHTLLLLVFKIVKYLQCILKCNNKLVHHRESICKCLIFLTKCLCRKNFKARW